MIDEFPIIVNPSMEPYFTLFRKFRTSMLITMQTLDQMIKNPFLKYLKGILLNSCTTHIVFGRTNINDQDVYSALSSTIDKVTHSTRYFHTALSLDNPTLTTSDNYDVKEVFIQLAKK